MDLVAACRAFVAVSRHGSFTAGATAARIPQSVASRRISALERHLGGQLLDRTSRVVALTAFGAELLPSARQLVELTDALEHDAETARRRPFRLLVPATCGASSLVDVVTTARRHGIHIDVRAAGPHDRAGSASDSARQAAIVATAPDTAAWRVPLGVAGGVDPGVPVIYVETLRPDAVASQRPLRRLWIQPEDDVPHVRDPVVRLGVAVGLLPAQTVVAESLVGAVADTIATDSLLLCSRAQADELGLHWRPIGELTLSRGYGLIAASTEDAARLRTVLHAPIARALGVPTAMTRETA